MSLNPGILIFIITNGTVLTDKVKKLLNHGNFDLAISIDSIRKERYEYIRKNASFGTVMENLDYFNGYAKSRGKTLSLSFTTQRENWDELPEVIDFCNRKGIIFFNSFLTAPFDLSLIFLTSEKLKEIYDYLSQFVLQENTAIEKYNKQVFLDYLKYIKHYEAKNLNGVDYTEQKDNYEEIISGYTNSLKEKELFKTRDALFEAIRLETLNTSGISNEVVTRKLNQLFESLNDNLIEANVLSDISNSPLRILINDVNSMSNEELLLMVKSKYDKSFAKNNLG